MVASVAAGTGCGTTSYDGSDGYGGGVHVAVIVNKGISTVRRGLCGSFRRGLFGLNPFGFWPY